MNFRKVLSEELPHPKKSAELTSKKYAGVYEYHFKVGEIEYVVHADLIDKDENKWEFGFVAKKGIKYGATGTGNVGKVFSSVLKALLEFVKKQKPEKIVFFLSDESKGREKVYDLLLSKRLVPGYNMIKKTSKSHVPTYYLHRKN